MRKTLKICCCIISVFIFHGCETTENKTADVPLSTTSELSTESESSAEEGEFLSDEINQIDIDLACRFTLGTAERAELVTFNSITETEDGHALSFTTWQYDEITVRTESVWDPVDGGMTSGWETELDYFDNIPNDQEFLLVYLIRNESSGDNIFRLLAEATREEIKDGKHGEVICQSAGLNDRKY